MEEGKSRRVHPALAWFVGIAAAALAFFTVGVWLLFNIAYSVMHGGFAGSAKVVFPAAMVAVSVICICLGCFVKRAVSRRR